MKRNATALWKGAGKEGKGTLNTQSGALNHASYTFNSRFGDENATNPEELIAAAHAGCFAMKLSIDLVNAGFPSESLEAKSVITMEGLDIVTSEITLNATVPGISEDKFQEIVNGAKDTCPVSKVLKAKTTVDAHLQN